ncbi:uncharacterized protein METZ01_LOCUS3298 [marine metagenome]|uniref:Uncharacterized protein n=1 Tax=marine metagenome TaxID=408172 RepID=A0A381N8Q7_9ZZZZ
MVIFVTRSVNPGLVLSMFFIFSDVPVIYSLESSAKILIPDGETLCHLRAKLYRKSPI